MSEAAGRILHHLARVNQLRKERAAEPGLSARVRAVKSYQSRRFEHTYGDLLASPRYRAAASFFLDELYGPKAFEKRDAQFARVVPALVRMLPSQLVETVATLGELHALSEEMDTRMAKHINNTRGINAADYASAWLACGQPQIRAQQLRLVLDIAHSLKSHTQGSLLLGSLRLMRRPAQSAGLGELQKFLESGLSAFKSMGEVDEFLTTIRTRETLFTVAMFNAKLMPGDGSIRPALAPNDAARVLLP